MTGDQVRPVTCYVVVCAGCGGGVDDQDEYPVQFPSPASALRYVLAEHWSRRASDRALICPSCTCAEVGHVRKLWGPHLVVCERCGRVDTRDGVSTDPSVVGT